MPVVLALDVRGLGLEIDHPQLALLEPALLLHDREQPLVVEMAVAEVPAGHDPGDELALADVVRAHVVDRARQQPVQRAAVGVHRAEREPLVEHELGQLLAVELLELAHHRGRELLHPLVELLLGAVLAEQPLAGGPVARVVAHRRQERDQVGAQVAQHRDAHPADREDRDQQRVVERGQRHVAVVTEQEQDPEDHEDVPLQRHAQRERGQDVHVEDHHPRHGDRPDRPALGEDQHQRQAELDHRAQVGRVRRHRSRADVLRVVRATAAPSPCARGSRACCEIITDTT